ncbi:hypothetical protein [Vibrio sp. D431a]|uniref:hypothetical protein n=1 Tax=Vibrio sp. D431a TaxID=2837388 RepID=UPI0025522D9E|nr:hypothetical protein [Vibrio sp. D431a]MDK9790183.1 hypothetical protein [Vibrio sp. D431a]
MLADISSLKLNTDLPQPSYDVLDAGGDVVLRLNLVSEEFEHFFDVDGEDGDVITELGFYDIVLPIASSWSLPKDRKARLFTKETPASIIEVAQTLLSGGCVLDEKRPLSDIVFYVPNEVSIEVDVDVAEGSFEHPSDYKLVTVTTSEYKLDSLVEIGRRNHPEKLLGFIEKYYEGVTDQFGDDLLPEPWDFQVAAY